MHWIADFLSRRAEAAVRHPGRTLAAWAFAALAAVGLAAARIEVKTSNLDLIDPNLPPVRRFLDFATAFGTPNVLVIVLEGKDPATLEPVVNRAAAAIRALPGIRAVMDRLPLPPDLLKDLGLEEYLRSRDRGLYFLFVQPEDTRSSVEALDPFVAGVRKAVASVQPESAGVKVGYTGIPQYALDDRDVIQKDTSRLTFLSFGLVFLIFWSCFGRFRRPMAAMGALLVGVTVTAGFIALFPGHLTLLSASFASVLFGLGVDYGVHIINRLEEHLSRGESEAEALPRAVADVARDITTGALTTAGVFASLWFCGFKGFEELGVIAAMGILVCLFAMCSALPALLALRPSAAQLPSHAQSGNCIGRVLLRLQHPALAWTLALGAGVLIWHGHPGFDSDYLDLQPKDSETVRLEREMEHRSDLSTQFAVFTTPTLAAAGALGEKLLQLPGVVADVRSAADLEAAAPGENLFAQLPPAFQRSLVGPQGQYAVYAYPEGNVWDPAVQRRFAEAMQAIDPEVTGMPILGKFLVERTQHALRMAVWIGFPLLVALVFLDFRHPLRTGLALLPTLLTFPALLGIMSILGFPFNPLNMMALPVILGIGVDDGVHLVHRFRVEKGNLSEVLLGAGRSVYLTSATTVAAFGSLALTTHRGLASFAILLSLGVILAFLFSTLLLPSLLGWCDRKGWLGSARA